MIRLATLNQALLSHCSDSPHCRNYEASCLLCAFDVLPLIMMPLQAWPIRHAAHPPKWNGFILRQSLAHRGFAVAWSRGTLRNSVISAIAAILEESGTTAEHMRILLTGRTQRVCF